MTRRVLVTHRSGTWPQLAARFRDTDISLRFAETATQVDPVDPGPGDRALAQLQSYAWLVVTSPRGAAALARRLRETHTVWPNSLRVAAVGASTASALAAATIEAEVVAASPTSVGLAASLRGRLKDGGRVLLVRPEGAPAPLAEALASAGAHVEVAPLYRTVASDEAAGLASAAIGGELAGVAFTAPSSLDRWLDAAGAQRGALESALSGLVRIAIGPTTAAHLNEAGLPADATAAAPTEAAIGDAIAAVFGL